MIMTNCLKNAVGMLANLGRKQNEEAELENMRINYNEKYYKELDEIHEQYDVFIHDMKHTMRTVNALAEEGRCKEIKELIEDMLIKVGNIQNRIICSHKILNALLTECSAAPALRTMSEIMQKK